MFKKGFFVDGEGGGLFVDGGGLFYGVFADADLVATDDVWTSTVLELMRALLTVSMRV